MVDFLLGGRSDVAHLFVLISCNDKVTEWDNDMKHVLLVCRMTTLGYKRKMLDTYVILY